MNSRRIRGIAIISKGDTPTSLKENEWRIPSQNNRGSYIVACQHETGWVGSHLWNCTCPDYKYRKIDCKHIHAIKFWLGIKESSMPSKEGVLDVVPDNIPKCVYCGSTKLRKDGKRKTKNGLKQRLECRACNRKFTVDAEYGKLSVNTETLTLVLDLYYKGISTRKISDHLKQVHGINVSHVTVYKWVKKYTKKINEYAETLKPQVGDFWSSDEMKVKIGGDWKWVYNCMDRKTRYALGNEITQERSLEETQRNFNKSKKVAGKNPKAVFTDGLPAYPEAVKKEFNPDMKNNCLHVRCPSLREKRLNNNIVERYNGTVREREKVVRGLKKDDTALNILDGFRNYYNLIKPHQGLNGQTPSNLAGINIHGQNKWHTLLQNSMKN